jgi:hypothetical protein
MVYTLGVLVYRPAHPGDPGRVDHREVVAGADLQLGADLDLAAEVHEERPVGDVYDLYVGQALDDVDDLLAVFRIASVDGDVPDGPLLLHPHDVDRADQAVSLPYGRKYSAE